MQSKCDKCDERGMIADEKIRGASRSCDCGYYNYLMEKAFEGISIEQLFSYASKRIEQKSLAAGILGSMKSEKKSIASRQNGKKGGRPKKSATPSS